MAHWSRDPSWLMYAPLAGLGVGMGARLIKHLIAQRRESVKPILSPDTELPVEVTPEEALQLEQRGQDVKLAGEGFDAWLKTLTGGPPTSALGGAIRGALGTAGALGGYALVDQLVDRARKKQLRKDIEHLRSRLSNVLQDQPATEDIPLHAQMKAAEDQYFEKNAGMFTNLLDTQLPVWLATAAGGAGLLSALGSFRQVRNENPNLQRISDLRAMLRSEGGPSKVTLAPVVDKVKLLALIRRKKQDEEPVGHEVAPVNRGIPQSELRAAAARVNLPPPRPKKPEVEPAQSPAMQAEQSLAF